MVAIALYVIVADTSTSAVVASEIVTVEYTAISSPGVAVPAYVTVFIFAPVTVATVSVRS
jgi:hypothetical protein